MPTTSLELGPPPLLARGSAGDSCYACCFSSLGLAIFSVSVLAIGWSECRTSCVQSAVLAAEAELTELGCLVSPTTHVGKLVFVSCPIREESLRLWTPSAFLNMECFEGAFSEHALRVEQRVEMFQCDETEHQNSDASTYSYGPRWSSRHLDSSRFQVLFGSDATHAWNCGHNFSGNPPFLLEQASRSTDVMMVGPYNTTRHLGSVPILEHVPLHVPRSDCTLPVRRPLQGPVLRERTFAHQGEIWTCDPEQAETPIGCMRVSYAVSAARHASFLAELLPDHSTQAWKAPTSYMCSDQLGHTRIDYFVARAVTPDEAIDELLESNAMSKWLWRVTGLLLAWLGLHGFMASAQTFADPAKAHRNVPLLLRFFGSVAFGSTGVTLALLSCAIAVFSTLFVVSIAGMVMRPLLATLVMASGVLGLGLVTRRMRSLAEQGRELRARRSSPTPAGRDPGLELRDVVRADCTQEGKDLQRRRQLR
eukprot:NODE_8449_length_1495_cov_3.989035.p1 GENE.NODE_8449_length_1495_cov_3.989035~~NODE_8449_length_1495_cov_3.989035.p1  ORF type:complete len:479 (-),score=119.29 NODE_8449_length_1495_cov_3.989035:12-1448(-)